MFKSSSSFNLSSFLLMISIIIIFFFFFFVIPVDARLATIWQTTLSSSSFASFTTPVISPTGNAVIVASTSESLLAALNAETGTEMWRSGAGKIKAQPSISCPDLQDPSSCITIIPARTQKKFLVANLSSGTQFLEMSTSTFCDTFPAAVRVTSNLDNNGATHSVLAIACEVGFPAKCTAINITLNATDSQTNTGALTQVWSKGFVQKSSTVSAVINNGQQFAVSDANGNFFSLDAATPSLTQQFQVSVGDEPVNFFEILDPTDNTIRLTPVSTVTGTVFILNSATGAIVHQRRVSTAIGGLTSALAHHPSSNVVIAGDKDGNVHALSLSDGQTKFSRPMSPSKSSVVSLTNLTLTSSQETLVKSKLGLSSSSNTPALIAGVSRDRFFILHIKKSSSSSSSLVDEVSVVFMDSPSSAIDGGISATSSQNNNNCIFAVQSGSVSCLNLTDLLSQLDPSKYNGVAPPPSKLTPAEQVAIIVVSCVVGGIIVALLLIFVIIPYLQRPSPDPHALNANNNNNDDNNNNGNNNNSNNNQQHRNGENEQDALRNQRANRLGGNNHQHHHQQQQNLPIVQRQYSNQYGGGYNPSNTGQAGIFEDLSLNNNNNNASPSSSTGVEPTATTRINVSSTGVGFASVAAATAASGGEQEMSTLFSNNSLRAESSGGDYSSLRLQQPLHANRTEIFSCKQEFTPAPSVDFSLIRYLSNNFKFTVTKEIVELIALCQVLKLEIASHHHHDAFLGHLAFRGKFSELLLCQVQPQSSSSSSSNNPTQLQIPHTIHSVIGVANHKGFMWLIIDTELLLQESASSSSASVVQQQEQEEEQQQKVNPFDEQNSKEGEEEEEETTTARKRRKQPMSLASVFAFMEPKLQHSWTCTTCFDEFKIEQRKCNEALLFPGALCSSQLQHPSHFSCSTCFSGAFQKKLEELESNNSSSGGSNSNNSSSSSSSSSSSNSMQILECLHTECDNTRKAAIDPPHDDMSGYFVFDDFASHLRASCLRKWQEVSKEQAKREGQRSVLSAVNSSSSSTSAAAAGGGNNNPNNNNNNQQENELVRSHVNAIKHLLIPRCPYSDCALPFGSFTACLCVTCGVRNTKGERTAGCGRQFCGYCLVPKNQCKKGHCNGLFMNARQIHEGWKIWRVKKVVAYLELNFSSSSPSDLLESNNSYTRRVLEKVLRFAVPDFVETGILESLPAPWNRILSQ